MREDPIYGEAVVLVVEPDQSDQPSDALESEIEKAGGTIEKRLPFDALRVRIAEERVDALCETGGIDSIRTDQTTGISGDPNEDM